MRPATRSEGGLVPGCGLSAPAWIVASVGAMMIHASVGAAIVTSLKSAEDDVALGAPSIEIGIEMSSPRLEQTDLPPGAEAESSIASPAMPEQRAVVEATQLERDKPTPSDDPDRIVSPVVPEKPKEDEPTKATVTTSSSQDAIASEATAPPVIENAPETERSVAPAQGTGDSSQRIKAAWQRELSAHINRRKRYPDQPARRDQDIVLKFTMDRVGHVIAVVIDRSSGDPSFDAAAIAMLRRSDPLPPPPPLIADEGLTFSLPVHFRGRGRA